MIRFLIYIIGGKWRLFHHPKTKPDSAFLEKHIELII